MDGDPGVDPELDALGLFLPLPYRISLLVVLAIWGWGLNLQVLHAHGVDVPHLIRYPPRPSATHPTHHLSTYRLAASLSIVFALSLLLFWTLTRGDPRRVASHDWLPLGFLAVLAAALAALPLPLRGLSGAGRGRLFATLRRVAVGGLAETRDGKFGDVLLADVLTSFAKVLGDLYVVLCMFARFGGSANRHPDRNCGGYVIVPLIIAWPSLMRLRQCLIEYLRVRRAPRRESVGWGGQHLANAAKYASALPVVVLAALQRNPPPGSAAPAWSRAWLAAVLVNSLYSWYWDVAKDWDLTLFSPEARRAAYDQPHGLRRVLVFRLPWVYYAVIGLDLVLRCAWVLRLDARPGSRGGVEGSIFAVQVLEVVRRWIWIFFRVETEWVRDRTLRSAWSSPSSSSLLLSPVGLGLGLGPGAPGQGDMEILLGDYPSVKRDSDSEGGGGGNGAD